MNILHMKYAVEVAKAGSLNKASENLFVALPNISRSIKELETDLGIVIFERSAKGVTLTPQGEEFIGYAKGLLKQITYIEDLYKGGASHKQRFSLSVPPFKLYFRGLFSADRLPLQGCGRDLLYGNQFQNYHR